MIWSVHNVIKSPNIISRIGLNPRMPNPVETPVIADSLVSQMIKL